MTPEEFREAGHRLVDWIADYVESIEERAVTPDVEPGDVLGRLPGTLRPAPSRSRRCSATSTASSCPGWCTGSTRLLRLLPRQQLVRGDPRRPAVGRARRQRDELGHVAGVHGAGAARRRLDGRAARPAAAVPQHQRERWWSHPGHGERQRSSPCCRHAGGRPGAPSTTTVTRPDWSPTPRRTPLEHREGAAHRQCRHQGDPHGGPRRGLRHAPRVVGRADRRRSPPG